MAIKPLSSRFPSASGPAAGPAAVTRADERRVIHQSALRASAEVIEAREAEAHSLTGIDALHFVQHERADVEFDEKQRLAQDIFCREQFATLIGYAGSGKTTSMKGVLPRLRDQVRAIDWGDFRSGGAEPSMFKRPAICMATFTNVAAKNLASKLPVEWTPHCMSIHSMLCYQPVDYRDEGGTMRFEPRYNSGNKLPLDIIIIDEAGIVPNDLWQNILSACNPQTRIYLLGDLAQMPAMHGASPLPFAMKKWPTVVLDTIYRQKEGGALIENLTRIRKGLPPVHHNNEFRMDPSYALPANVLEARRKIAQYLQILHKTGFWDPRQDIILTPYRHSMLGVDYWNGAFRMAFNPKQFDAAGKWINPPILIRTPSGGEVSNVTLAVGDKVMSTTNGGKSAREARFSNGSIGIIVGIRPNERYTGSMEGLGEIGVDHNADLKAMWTAIREAEEGVDLLSELETEEAWEADDDADDKKSRAASHIVTVVEQSTGDVYELSAAAEVAALEHAYATTCHKYQGSQARHVMVIVHSSMPNFLHREWLYTACSRAQKKVFLLAEPSALVQSCNRARLPGKTADEKADNLVALYRAEKHWAVPPIPNPRAIDWLR